MFHAIYIRFYNDQDWHYYTGLSEGMERTLYRAHSIVGAYRGQYPEIAASIKEVEKGVDASSRVKGSELEPLSIDVVKRKRAKVLLEEAG